MIIKYGNSARASLSYHTV